MDVAKLMGKVQFEDGVSSLATSKNGDFIAVGTRGILGLYGVQYRKRHVSVFHLASYVIPGNVDYAITEIRFSDDEESLSIVAEDGIRRELSLTQTRGGMLVEIGQQRAA